MQGFTFLMITASRGHLSVAKELLTAAAGADVNAVNNQRRWPLLFAANEGHIEIVYELLACGVDCNQFYYYGTALTMACQSGHLDVVKALLAHGAHVNWGDDEASTPLHYACSNEQLPVVRCLLRHGANPFLKEDNGDSPRTLAILILSSDGPSKKRIAIMAYNKEEHAYKYAPHNPQREQCFTFVKAAGQS
ncbi:hypothetical protein WJX82_005610 [Trebouxia sp. C0006]